MSGTPDRYRTLVAALLLGAAAMVACNDARTVGPAAGISAAASGNGNSKPGSGTVVVTATNPALGRQGQVNEAVTITGSGFKTGAKASWERNGTVDPKVTVVSTQFVSSTEIVATISIAVDAVVDLYDVAVLNSDRTKGIGNLLFKVDLGDPTTTFYFPLADGALALRSDHLYSDGTSSVYANGVCGVTGSFFATDAASNSGDAYLQTDKPNAGRSKKCADYPRQLYLDYGDGLDAATIVNAREIETSSYFIPVGASVRRKLVIPSTTHGCGNVVFGEASGVGLSGDSVMVTRVSASEWHVQSQPSPNDSTLCLYTGQMYHMPVDFTITSSRPLP
jgi:hypothetical protein